MTREMVVLCDEQGRAIGEADKATVHTASTPLHLAFSSYVFDPDGRLLVTRRARAKATWGGVRTNTCCGHPAPGERLTDAVSRRLQTELGLAPERLTVVLPQFRYRAVMANGIVENEVCPVFMATVAAGTEPRPAPGEVDDTWWQPWPEFVSAAAATDDPLSPWAAQQVELLVRLGPDPHAWAAAGEPLPAAAL